jgi:hypothetical protein
MGTLAPRKRGSAPKPTVPLIRGTGLGPIAAWLAQAGGEAALREAYDRLPEDARAGLRPNVHNLGIEPRAWYATAAAPPMLAEAERRHALDDREAYLRMVAERIMRDGINVFHRALFKLFVSPRTAVENIATAWERYYNEGRCTAEMDGETSCHAIMSDWRGHHPLLCESTAYCGVPILRLAGARQVAVRRVQCVADGAPDCRWNLSWQ